jgi:hypothetical protein
MYRSPLAQFMLASCNVIEFQKKTRSSILDFDLATHEHVRQHKTLYANTSVQSLEFEVLRQRQELVELQELLDMREEEVSRVILFLCVCGLLMVAVRRSLIP